MKLQIFKKKIVKTINFTNFDMLKIKRIFIMKKLFFLAIASVLTLSSFTNFKTVKDDDSVKMHGWKVYCNGVYAGSFYCDCTRSHAQKVANAMCNP